MLTVGWVGMGGHRVVLGSASQDAVPAKFHPKRCKRCNCDGWIRDGATKGQVCFTAIGSDCAFLYVEFGSHTKLQWVNKGQQPCQISCSEPESRWAAGGGALLSGNRFCIMFYAQSNRTPHTHQDTLNYTIPHHPPTHPNQTHTH